jgi:hypothetical protein
MLPRRLGTAALPSPSPAIEEDEITNTSVGPLGTNVLRAVMAIRCDEKERGRDAGPSSGVRERSSLVDRGVLGRGMGEISDWDAHASTPLSSDLREAIPSGELLDRWLSGLHEQEVSPVLSGAIAPQPTTPYIPTAYQGGVGRGDRKKTLVMPGRPAAPVNAWSPPSQPSPRWKPTRGAIALASWLLLTAIVLCSAVMSSAR